MADKSENITSLNKIHVWLEIGKYLSLRPSPMIEEIREHLLLIFLYLPPTPQTKPKLTYYSTMDFCESVVQNPYLDPECDDDI